MLLLLLQQRFIFYQSGLITHNMSGPSIPDSPLLLRAQRRVSHSRQRQRGQYGESKQTTSVCVYENMINPLSQRGPECHPLVQPPLTLYGTTADRLVTAVMTGRTAGLLRPE